MESLEDRDRNTGDRKTVTKIQTKKTETERNRQIERERKTETERQLQKYCGKHPSNVVALYLKCLRAFFDCL